VGPLNVKGDGTPDSPWILKTPSARSEAKQARIFRVRDSEELNLKKTGLQKITKNWIKIRDQ
jgi:hypothetical protein